MGSPSHVGESGRFWSKDSDEDFDKYFDKDFHMSSALRLSIIMVFVLAAAALGLIAYSINAPKPHAPAVVQVAATAPAPVTIGYFVASHPLARGTLVRDDDFTVRSVASQADVPEGAIIDRPDAKPDAKAALRGSLVRNYLDAGAPVTAKDILRPQERGFLASVLAPDTRALSISVDATSGVSGLIWPGDYVDVVLTQKESEGARATDQQHATMSETVVHNVRVVAIDQDIMQGGRAVTIGKDGKDNAAGKDSAAGKVAKTVTLQLAPDQVRKVTVATQLGKLSLAVRAAVDRQDSADTDTTVVVYTRNNGIKYSVKRDNTGSARASAALPAQDASAATARR